MESGGKHALHLRLVVKAEVCSPHSTPNLGMMTG